MAIKKQPDSEPGTVDEAANDWFRQFLKHLEISLAEIGQELPPNAAPSEFGWVAVRAVKLTLLDSGLNEEQIHGLFERVVLEKPRATENLEWNAELNKRRFELIDGEIQGTLSRAEQMELAGLTQLMREHVDSEQFLPMAGAKKLHQYLTGQDSSSPDSQP